MNWHALLWLVAAQGLLFWWWVGNLRIPSPRTMKYGSSKDKNVAIVLFVLGGLTFAPIVFIENQKIHIYFMVAASIIQSAAFVFAFYKTFIR